MKKNIYFTIMCTEIIQSMFFSLLSISFASQLFFSYNENLKPPYKILIDTNFINFSIQNKLDIIDASM